MLPKIMKWVSIGICGLCRSGYPGHPGEPDRQVSGEGRMHDGFARGDICGLAFGELVATGPLAPTSL